MNFCSGENRDSYLARWLVAQSNWEGGREVESECVCVCVRAFECVSEPRLEFEFAFGTNIV